MEILQVMRDRIMGQSSKRFTTPFVVVVIFIAFSVFLMMYRNSSFALFEVLTKGKVVLGEGSNVTTTTTNGFPLGGGRRHHNISDDETIEGNNTMSKVQGKIQNGTTATEGRATAKNNIRSQIGLKNGTLTSSTNDSSTPHSDKDNKLLLDGLLASGFDEASCISRQQSHLYRKASPHKPSPYLVSKLRNYEEIHRRCGPNGRAYNRHMTKIIAHSRKNNVAASTTMCKYLIWTPVNGLGNQMISMAATFLYAILTNRVLLVKFGKDKHGLFCEPFLNSTWVLPQKSPFWNEKIMHVETYQSILEKDHMTNNTSKEDLLLPSALFLSLQHTGTDPEKLFHCDHSQDLLKNVPLLILLSDQYFVPSLFMTPLFNKEIEKMFPEKDTIFHHLGRYLFHPSNEAWGLITTFYQAHLAKANERIGLQIRVFDPVSTPQQTIMNLVLNCTIQNKLLPKVGSVQNSVSSSSGNKNQTFLKVVLVASLYQEYGENLSTLYLKKPTVTGEVIEVYQPSHEEHQKLYDNKHNMKAWTDMYLLSLSDVLVTTSLSTFGYVAQGLGNLRPWLLYKLVSNKTHFPACERDFSLEPCYHVPPKHYCNGKPMNDVASSFLYMRKCKDFWFGVKLVNKQ